MRPSSNVKGLVALLCLENNAPAALRLESFWNTLQKRTQSFSLFCAYPIQQENHTMDSHGFMDICSLHSHMLLDTAEQV